MRNSNRRRAVGIAALALLGTVGVGLTPAQAQEPPIETSALEFDPSDYPQCRFNGQVRTIRYLVDRIVANSPGPFDADGDASDEDGPLYAQPTDEQREHFRAGLTALIDDDPATANQHLSEAGYAVCSGEVDGTTNRHTVLVYHVDGLSASETDGQPMLLLNPGQAADATLLSGPHLRTEAKVKNQILAAVGQTGLGYVRGAVLSGTHRCNRLAEAPQEYQGTTQMCGGRYRISDMAHNIDTIFQDMHDVIREEYPLTYSVQLHGMSEDGISVSRGARPNAGSANHPQAAVTRAHAYAYVYLRPRLTASNLTDDADNLTTCTPYVHSGNGQAMPQRDLHCGTRNAQLDREQDLGGADRFIHIEQSMDVRTYYPEYVTRVMYGLFAD